MTNFNEAVKNNPLKTRHDLEKCLLDLVTPLYTLMEKEGKKGRVHLGDSGSVYNEERREIEGFLRTLWGLGPLFSLPEGRKKYAALKQQAETGILAGVDPQSNFYWGELTDYDQLFVEMGALATYLILTKENFYDTLEESEQENIYQWLNQINQHTIPPTNWVFFRILVNTFFAYCGRPNEDQLLKDLGEIQQYYLKDGWYFDGYENQIDYYIPFGMQYYGVLFSQLAFDKQMPLVAELKKRGEIFAKTFKDWFVKDGTALPFGRSLSYRFAQSSFFAVGAFAHLDYPDFSCGEGKHLLLQNMRQWFARPIFSDSGLLTVGYGYPNLVMAEGYNAPGSPYWAFKNFMVLALPKEDIFWQTEEVVPEFPEKVVNPYSRMILHHSKNGEDLTAFTMGQHSHEHAHGESKYEKFAYSTTFGFSVAKGTVLPKQGAFDSTLAVALSPQHFQTVFGYDRYQLHENYLYGKWTPYQGTTIETFVIPSYPWHLRIHVIHTTQELFLQGGSFSAPKDGKVIPTEKNLVLYESSVGTTGAYGLTPNWQAELQTPEPNTNLLYPQTQLPILTGKAQPGKSLFVGAFLGEKGKARATDTSLPEYRLVGNHLTFKTPEEVLEIDLIEFR